MADEWKGLDEETKELWLAIEDSESAVEEFELIKKYLQKAYEEGLKNAKNKNTKS